MTSCQSLTVCCSKHDEADEADEASSLLLQELQAQLSQRAEQYHRLLDQGESMLLARGGEEAGPGTTQTQQNLAMLQNKWASLNTKMDDRRVKASR